jgi:hypothetical protein
VSNASGKEVYRSEQMLQIDEGSRITLDVNLDRFKLSQSGGGTPQPGDQPKPWVVSGTVTDQQGNPLAGLTVQVTSREIKLDKPLGETNTNRKGQYQIRVIEDPTIKELKPGIQLTISVFSQDGQQVYTSDEEILFKPGEQITYDIQPNPPGKKIRAR